MHVATVGQEACLVHSQTGQSVVPGRGKVAHQPSHRQVVGSRRCKTEQAKGRLPYLVTRALVLWRSLHAHKLRDKGVGGRITSAGTSQMRYQKRRCSPPPSPHRQVVVGRGRAGTEVRRARSYLLREGRLRAPKLCSSLGCFLDVGILVGFAVFLPGTLVVPGFPSRGSPSSSSSASSRVFSCWGSRGLGVVLFAGRLGRLVSSPPGEGVELLLCVCSRSWSSRSSFSSSSFIGASVAPGPLVLDHAGLRRYSRCLCIWAVSRYFPSCGVPARWRDLRHVVFDICRM